MPYAFLKLGARWGWVVNATLRQIYAGKQTLYPFDRRLGGSRAGIVECGKFHPRDSILIYD